MVYVKISSCILLCLFVVSCTEQKDIASVDLAEGSAQAKPMTAEERISILEGRIDMLSSELQTYTDGTNVVGVKNGKKTNYAKRPAPLGAPPDLNSTVHRIVPRPNAGTSSAPKSASNMAKGTNVAKGAGGAVAKPSVAQGTANNRPVAMAKTPVLGMPPTTASAMVTPSMANNKTVAQAEMAQEDTPLSLPPENAGVGLQIAPVVNTPAATMAVATTPATTAVATMQASTTANGAGKVPTQAMSPASMQATAMPATMQAAAMPGPVMGLKASYENALNKALAGKFNEAISLFENYLQNFPNSKYSPNAYYWIGECLYAQKRFPEALLKFKDVATRYPKHHKTADALLKAGMTYDLLGDDNNAVLQYNALLDDFPRSGAANIVRSWGYVQ